jgi:acyl dehydratase
MKTYASIDELKPLVGELLGQSDWITIEQSRIQQFADATDDHQWIHLDVERAEQGPFKTTIAHGFLTLSLLVPMASKAYAIGNVGMGVNYGLNKVRFPSPVAAGSKVRGNFKLQSFEPIEGGAQLTLEVTIEVEGGKKPVCVAEWVVRQYAATADQPAK